MLNFFKKKKSPDWTQYLNQTEANYGQQNFTSTISNAQKAISILESSKGPEAHLSWAYFLWGRAAMDTGDHALAYEKLSHSVQLDNSPTSENPPDKRVSITFSMAELLFKMQEFERAKGIFTHIESAITEIQPDGLHMRVFIYLAQIHEQLRSYEEAIGYFGKYLTVTANILGKEKSNYHGVAQHRDQLKVALDAKKKGFPEPWITIQYENGGAAMIDIQYAAYLVSELPNPSQVSLKDILGLPRSLRVIDRQFVEDAWEETVKYETGEEADIQQIISEINMDEKNSVGHLMGNGHYFVILGYADGKKVEIEFLTAGIIRIADRWKDDAALTSSAFLKEWFTQIGIHFNSPGDESGPLSNVDIGDIFGK